MDYLRVRRVEGQETCRRCARPHQAVSCDAYLGLYASSKAARVAHPEIPLAVFSYSGIGAGPWWAYKDTLSGRENERRPRDYRAGGRRDG